MENHTKTQDKQQPAPLQASSLNTTSNSCGNYNTTNGATTSTSPPAPPPLVPKSIPKAPDVNPYPTTFIQADTSSFKQVVQMLTGSAEIAAAAAAASATSKGPPSPANGHGTATPLRGLRPRSREGNGGSLRWPCLPRPGLRPKKVAIHSSWITLVSLFLIHFSTADTSGPTETRVFTIAGAAAASLPSLLIFLSTAAITYFLEAGFCDLTWIFSGSGGGPPRRKRRQDRSTEGDGKEDEIDTAGTTAGDGGEAADGAGKNRSVFPSTGDEASTLAAEDRHSRWRFFSAFIHAMPRRHGVLTVKAKILPTKKRWMPRLSLKTLSFFNL